jgi:hypothetical protein
MERAQDMYAILAEGLGMRTVFSSSVTPKKPLAASGKASWLLNQPHRVLEIGKGDVQHTLMFHFHMDTLGPHLPSSIHDGQDDTILCGRGMLDSKGPAVALLAALGEILQQRPDIFEHIRIVIQMAGSAKECPMGQQNAVDLAQHGLYGHLNVFMQADDARHFETCTLARRETLAFATSDFKLDEFSCDAPDFMAEAEGIFSAVVQPAASDEMQEESVALTDLYCFMQDLGDLIVTFAERRAGVVSPFSLSSKLDVGTACVLTLPHPATAANGDNFRISL